MGLRNLNFVMKSVRFEPWRTGMGTRRVMMKGGRESLNVLAVIFGSPGFNWCSQHPNCVFRGLLGPAAVRQDPAMGQVVYGGLRNHHQRLKCVF